MYAQNIDIAFDKMDERLKLYSRYIETDDMYIYESPFPKYAWYSDCNVYIKLKYYLEELEELEE